MSDVFGSNENNFCWSNLASELSRIFTKVHENPKTVSTHFELDLYKNSESIYCDTETISHRAGYSFVDLLNDFKDELEHLVSFENGTTFSLEINCLSFEHYQRFRRKYQITLTEEFING